MLYDVYQHRTTLYYLVAVRCKISVLYMLACLLFW